jgi:hypothetical protein
MARPKFYFLVELAQTSFILFVVALGWLLR